LQDETVDEKREGAALAEKLAATHSQHALKRRTESLNKVRWIRKSRGKEKDPGTHLENCGTVPSLLGSGL